MPKTLLLRLSEEEHEQIKQAAWAARRSMNSHVKWLVFAAPAPESAHD